MKRLFALTFLVFLVAGCGHNTPPCLNANGVHEWGKWEDVGTNMANQMVQHRTCKVCGAKQVGYHQ